MALLNKSEVYYTAEQCGFSKVLNWNYDELQDKVVGYLGDHLNLIIEVEANGVKSQLKLFIKCMPRFDIWKTKYLNEMLFFKKEYVMLSKVFKEFDNPDDSRKWRPKLLFIREDLFIFENVSLQGYKMPHHQETMSFEELKGTAATLARFHAQSYIFEERKSMELGRPYRIWEEYGEYLQEPSNNLNWRNTGKKAVIDYLKVFSEHRAKPNFDVQLERVVTELYDKALECMKPSLELRNVIVHRDLWTNNIFLKKDDNSDYHALFVDFQTVIYSSPMLDLSSLVYFNTSRSDRTNWTGKFLDFYYTILSTEVKAGGLNIEDIINKNTIEAAYEKSRVFGLTQAGLIIPITMMSKEQREAIFCNLELSEKVNVVSRSEELIEIAKENDKYRAQITELLDEIVDRYVFPGDNGINIE